MAEASTLMLKEMVTMFCPNPNGNIPVNVNPAAKGEKDQLKALLQHCGFEFLTLNQMDFDKYKLELDPDNSGTTHIDKLVSFLAEYQEACMDEAHLIEAFQTFDADNGGMLSLEEFEFFIESFGKDHSRIRDSNIVKEMVETCKENADEESKFEIKELV